MRPVGAGPLPHRELVEVSVKSAKKIDPAIWVRKQHRTSYTRRTMRSSDMRPSRSCPIPHPRVSLVICSIVSAEEHYFMSDTVVRHLGGSPRRRRGLCRDLRPRNTVECPRVVQITRAVESTKHDYFAAVWIVSHRKIRARWRRTGGRKLNPTSSIRLNWGCSQSECDCTAAADKNHKHTRKMPDPLEFHRRELRRSTGVLSNCAASRRIPRLRGRIQIFRGAQAASLLVSAANRNEL